MSKRKYTQGKQIESMCDFAESESKFFIVHFGNKPCTKHRAFLISWQYQLLERFIKSGRVFEAKAIEREDER